MDIYIKWENDTKGFKLPINPESFRISDSMNNTSVIVHDFGEVNLKGKRNLKEITLEAFFPGQQYDFARDSYKDPYEYYIKSIKAVFESNTTVHLIITQTDIDGFYTIESFEYGHEERNQDVAYSITLKEYREAKAVSAVSSGGTANRVQATRTTKQVKTVTHKWKKGDTWQKLAKSNLGSSKNWKSVRKANLSVIKKAKKKHPKKKEKLALVGYKVVIKG